MRRIWKGGLALVLSVLLLAGCTDRDAPEETGGQEAEKAPSQTMAVPCVLEEGRLTVESVLQFSGMNPDSGNAEASDAAALEVKNTSVLHLGHARLTLTLDDGTDIEFVVEDLPAGQTAMVFSHENVPMEEGSQREIRCEAEFLEESPLAQDRISASVDGMTITLHNTSDEALTDVKVYCHSLLEGSCYGGLTYCYTIDKIDAGATAAVEATDCYLDGALLARIEG